MKKLFHYELDFSISYYLHALRLNKHHSIVNVECAKQKFQEEMYILKCLNEYIEIDFERISHEAINNVLICVEHFDSHFNSSWEDIRTKESIVITLLSMNLFRINLSNYFVCQFQFLHFFKRMHSLSINVADLPLRYLERENIYEMEHEKEFIILGNDVIEEKGLEIYSIRNEDSEDFENLSLIFKMPLQDIEDAAKNVGDEIIAETIEGILPKYKKEIFKTLDGWPVTYAYQTGDDILYLYYGEEPLYGPYRLDMLLDLLEVIHMQGE
ncbi:hypothetical protein [Bacillus cereus]|uniref:Uncharacterized protein n=1 Tax=Bacillus cereus VD048 TaxID=1053226 RepID=J8HLS1_BACCE|nr:hypothetical protein [Bacillus cereus]EJR26825.1 hypothetical protein IIG_05148 [Bacillus cereus VD048]